jgi:large subunit ribosomal protein L7Ae
MVSNYRKIQEKGPQGPEYGKRSRISLSKKKFSFKKDLARFIKWPKYIKIQRQRRIFSQKLKIPPAVFQFSRTLDKNMTNQLFQLLSNYKPNDIRKDKNFSKKNLEKKRPKNTISIKHGIDTVSKLIKNGKSLFVLIANDVNPIDCVIWMPTLCAKLGVPYCIVKNKSRLGSLIGRKSTSCVALTHVNPKDNEYLDKLLLCFKKNFNERYSDAIKRWGGEKS